MGKQGSTVHHRELYSHLTINHNGKESAKEQMCVCVCVCVCVYNRVTLLSSRNSHDIKNQLYFNKISFKG